MEQPRSERARAEFEQGLCRLLVRCGASDDARLAAAVRVAVDHMLEAMHETGSDGASLAPLDVVRIRANKLAALHLTPERWREPGTVAALRAEIHALARAWLGPDAARGARFGGLGPGGL